MNKEREKTSIKNKKGEKEERIRCLTYILFKKGGLVS